MSPSVAQSVLRGWLADAAELRDALERGEARLGLVSAALHAEAWRYDVPAAAPASELVREHERVVASHRRAVDEAIQTLQAWIEANEERTRA